MGHHINQDGQFQSDKYPDLAPDKIVLSFKDPAARIALGTYLALTTDRELADDIRDRLMAYGLLAQTQPTGECTECGGIHVRCRDCGSDR